VFPRYFIEHPTEVRDLYLGPASYFWAALAGPIYVLRMAGIRGALRAAGPTLLCLLVLAAVVAVTMYLPKPIQAVSLVAAPLLLFAYQARRIVELVRVIYAARGWTVHQI
jgi:lysylphosphatidylglycerol synthetase-like protein (DUF2156 family)